MKTIFAVLVLGFSMQAFAGEETYIALRRVKDSGGASAPRSYLDCQISNRGMVVVSGLFEGKALPVLVLDTVYNGEIRTDAELAREIDVSYREAASIYRGGVEYSETSKFVQVAYRDGRALTDQSGVLIGRNRTGRESIGLDNVSPAAQRLVRFLDLNCGPSE